MATAQVETEVERQEEFGSTAQKSTNIALSDVATLRGRDAVADRRETKLVSNASVASRQIAGDTAELPQACDKISTQNGELAKLEQSDMCIKSLEDSVPFYEPREESLKSELTAATTERNQPGQLFDSVCAKAGS